MSKEFPTPAVESSTDYSRLSKSQLNDCLYKLLAQPASNQQASELLDLVHELQVNQIELEIQNRELRESQQRLEEANIRYAELYDFAPVGYLTLDRQGKILELNLRAAAMLGRERTDILGLSLLPFLAPGEGRSLFKHLALVLQSNDKVVHEFKLKPINGMPSVVQVRSVAMNGGMNAADRCRVALMDVSQQRQIEDELKQSEKRFRGIFEQAAVGVAVVNSNNGTFQKTNKKCSDIIGYSESELQTLDFMQISHPDDLRTGQLIIQRLLAGQINECSLEIRLFHKDGAIVWVKLTVSPLWDKAHKPDFHLAIVEDITQRKRAESILDGRNKVLELMANGAGLDKVLTSLIVKAEEIYPEMCFAVLKREGDALILSSATPQLAQLVLNAKGSRLINCERGCYSAAATLGGQRLFIDDLMAGPSCTFCRDAAKITGLTSCWLEPVISSFGEVLGSFISYGRSDCMDTPLDRDFTQGSARLASIAIERDQDERHARQRQAELAHLARLNMMGEMATGMAHELNQPLAAISTYTSVALRMLPASSKESELLEEALQGARQQALRASEIIRHLRQLVRKQAPQKADVDINKLLKNVIELTEFEACKHDIQLTLKLSEGLPNVSVDSIQIEQVLLNLLRNSIEALQSVSGKERQVIIHTYLNRDDWVQVEVVDNGPGMSPDVLDNLFKPFISTKGATGMGMGLSISRSIVEAHCGRLWAESKPDQGSSFFLTLPLDIQSPQE